MKKALSTLLVCVLLVGMIFTLASCGAMLSGTYENDLTGTTFEFKGNKYTMTQEVPFVDDVVKSGTYKITGEEGDREITFTYKNDDGEKETETYSFSESEREGKKYIQIGLSTYEKAD